MIRATRLPPVTSDVDLDDLEPLRGIVGDARVVALGEGAHGVREFTDARTASTRFLVERLGFTVVAQEVGVPAGFDLDAWIGGGDDDLAGLSPEATRWGGDTLFRLLREHNRHAACPVRFVGIDVPGPGGSLLPALTPLRDHLADADPDLLPLLDTAIDLAARFAAGSVATALPAWHGLGTPDQDASTAALARLRALMRSREPDLVDRTSGEDVDRALALLDSAIAADHQFGASAVLPTAGEQMTAAVGLRDRFMADTVTRRLDLADPDVRVVLLAHNTHVQKTPLRYWPDAEPAMLPMGHHLAGRLGGDYVAVAMTHTADSVPQMVPDSGDTLAPVALEAPAATSIEAAVRAGGHHDVTLVTTRPDGLAGLDRIRAGSGWSYTGVADAFDAVLSFPSATPGPARDQGCG